MKIHFYNIATYKSTDKLVHSPCFDLERVCVCLVVWTKVLQPKLFTYFTVFTETKIISLNFQPVSSASNGYHQL